MKTPITESQTNIGINSRIITEKSPSHTNIATPLPFITPYFTIPDTPSSDDLTVSPALSSLSCMIENLDEEETNTHQSKPIEESNALHFGAWPTIDPVAHANKVAAIRKIFGSSIHEKSSLVKRHLEEEGREKLEDPTSSWRSDCADRPTNPPNQAPKNKAALKQVIFPDSSAPRNQKTKRPKPVYTAEELKKRQEQAAYARTAKKLKRQKLAQTPISPTIRIEKLSKNAAREKTKTADASTSTRIDQEVQTKIEDVGDDQEIIEISDDDGESDVKIENEDVGDDHRDGEEERTPTAQRHVIQDFPNIPSCACEINVQTEQPTNDPPQISDSNENQAAQSGSCSNPTVAEHQQHQQYILSGEVAALLLQQQQPSISSSQEAGPADQQQIVTTVVENIQWADNLSFAMDPSQVPATPLRQGTSSMNNGSIVQQAAAASNIPTGNTPETIFTPAMQTTTNIPNQSITPATQTTNIPSQNINIQQQQNVTSVSIGQQNQHPAGQNQQQQLPAIANQNNHAFGMPILPTHHAFPFMTAAIQNNNPNRPTFAIQGSHQQQISDQPENYATSKYPPPGNTIARSPPPAHRHSKQSEIPGRMSGPLPRTPTPSIAIPPNSNHGGIIRAPTVPMRPHCPWCQQVAQWEHHARMTAHQAKEMTDISKSAKYHAEKLRDHGCPPPPPPLPPQ